MSDRDQHHEVCTATLPSVQSPLLTCWPAVAEASYKLLKHSGPAATHDLLRTIDGGLIGLVELGVPDVAGIRAIQEKSTRINRFSWPTPH
ncbi:hypothetical protein [Botrimarina sp.]|uniref:hypothetical protein n=1 Tax=Botrimarina sp. TaxID=2795802 RepID=UPI0032EE7022